MKALTEHELLVRIADGDEHAFSILFRDWSPRLMAYIFKVTRSRQVSEEIVQDVFTKIWQHRDCLNTINNFQHYLFVIARNHALNELEKIAAYWKLQRNFAHEQKTGTLSEESPVEDILENALHKLSPRQREIWLLNRRERYTYEEIADRLGISRETVKSHLKTATQSVTQLLNSRAIILLALVCA